MKTCPSIFAILVALILTFGLVMPAAADYAETDTNAALFDFMGTPSTNLAVIGATGSDAWAWDPNFAGALSQSQAWVNTGLLNSPMLDIAYTNAGVASLGAATGLLSSAEVSGFVGGRQEVAVGSPVTYAGGVNLAFAAFHSDDFGLFNAQAAGVAELEQISVAYQFITPNEVEAGLSLVSQSYALGEDTIAFQHVRGSTYAAWGAPGVMGWGSTYGSATNFGNGYAQSDQVTNIQTAPGYISVTAQSISQSGNF